MQRGLDKPFYFLLFSYFSDTSGGLEELFELLWGWYFALWHGKKQVSCMCLYQRKCKDFLLNENSSTSPGGSDPSGCQGREPAKEEGTADIWWREKGVRERINRQTWSKIVAHRCESTDQTQTGYRAVRMRFKSHQQSRRGWWSRADKAEVEDTSQHKLCSSLDCFTGELSKFKPGSHWHLDLSS